MNVFLDSDVVISSFISSSGAAYYLLNSKIETCNFYISDFSIYEIDTVSKRLGIPNKLEDLMDRLNVINLDKNVKTSFIRYVYDINDVYIVLGASESSSIFLLTYNIKDYKEDLIKNELNIIVIKPGNFLQYLRNR